MPSVDQERRERGTRNGQRTEQLHTGEREVPPELSALKDQIAAMVGGLTGAAEDLQETSRGIHPAILSRGGLRLALKTLARRCTVPVDVHFDVEQRLPESAEVAVDNIVAEAPTNTAKHAQASEIRVKIESKSEAAPLHLSIHNDGIGGADSSKGLDSSASSIASRR